MILSDTKHPLTVEEIKELTHTDEFLGTRVDKSLMKELTREIPSLNFSLKEEYSINMIKNNFDKNLPTYPVQLFVYAVQ